MAFGAVRGTLQAFGGSITASYTATGSVAVSAGDLVIVVAAEISTCTTTAITDNLSGTYTQAVGGNSAGGVGGKIFYRYVTSGGTLTTLTATATASGNDYATSVAVFEGPFTSTPLDRAPGTSSDNTSPFTPTIGTGTLSQANELVIMGLALTRGQTNTLATSPLLLAHNVASGTANGANTVSAATGYQVTAATTPLTPSMTCASGTFNGGVQILSTFRRGAFDTGTGSTAATSTASGTTQVDIARAGTAAAVATGTGAGRSDVSRPGTAAAAGSASATGLATTGSVPNCILNWNLAAGTGTDISGNSNDGVFHGGVTPTSIGPIGNAAVFDGSTGNVVNDQVVNISYASLSIWVKTTSSNSHICGFGGIGDGVHEKDINIRSDGTISWYVYLVGTIVGTKPINNGYWHHIVCTISATTQAIYIDSVLDVSGSGGASYTGYSAVSPHLGGYDQTFTAWTPGTFDDFRVYDRGITASEVLALYSEGVLTHVGTASAHSTALGRGPGIPNTVVNSVGSGAGRDYSTLASWAASLPANLVTDDNSYIAELYNDSEFTNSGSTVLSLSGHTTSATRNIVVRAATGHSFRDDANVQTNALNYNQANGVALNPGGFAPSGAIYCVDDYVTFSGLQLTKYGPYDKTFQTATGNNHVLVENCIITNSGFNNSCLLLFGNTTLRNCLIINSGPTFSGAVIAGFGGRNFYFCTIVTSSDVTASIALNSGYGTDTIQNCAIFGSSTITSGSTVFNFSSCMSDHASPPTGITGSKTYANQFVNTAAASGDYRVKSGADLIGAGTADSTNGAFDIAGTTRPQDGTWDIGAWEFKTAVAADTGAGAAAGFSIAYGDGSSGKNSFGTAVALSNAAATGRADSTGLGAAAGLATASATGRTDGRASGTGAAVGGASATGRADFASLTTSSAIATVGATATSDMRSVGVAAALSSAAGASAAGIDAYGAGASAGAGLAGATARSDARSAGSSTATGTATGTGSATGLDSYGVAAASGVGLASAAWRADIRSAASSSAAGVATGASSLTGLDSNAAGAAAATGLAASAGRSDVLAAAASAATGAAAGISSYELNVFAVGAASGAGLGQAATRSDARSAASSAATGLATAASSLSGLDSYAAGAAAGVGLAGASSNSDARSLAASSATGIATGSSSSELNVFGDGAASGVGLGQAVGRSDIRSVASTVATAAALGASSSELHVSGVGAAAGSGLAASTGFADFRASASTASAGIASAVGDAGRAGAATATATGTAVGIADIGYTTGAAAATGSAAGTGRLDVRVVANATATGTASSNGRADFRAAGNAAAAGFARAVMLVVGQATSTSTAVAAGRSDVRRSGLAAGLGFADAFATSDTRSVAISVALGHAVSFSVEPGSTTKTIELRGYMPAPISLTGHMPAAVVLAGSPTTAGLVGHAPATIALTGQRIDHIDLTGDMGV